VRRVVRIDTDRHLPRRRADRAGYEAGFVRRSFVPPISGPPGAGDRRGVDLVDQIDGQIELDHAHRRGPERIRFDDVAAGFEIGGMDFRDFLRMSQAEDIGKVTEVLGVLRKPLAPNGPLVEIEPLDHRAHRPIQQQNSFADQLG